MALGDSLKLARPKNIALALPTVVLGAYIVQPQQWSTIDAGMVCLNALSVVGFMAAGNILNDLVDFETDKVNHPDRPLPTGQVSINSAKQIVAAATLVSFFSMLLCSVLYYHQSSTLPLFSMAIWLTACILMITYELGPSTKNQGLKGNISISVMVGLVILYGASVLSALNNSPLVFAAAATAAFANLAREILKDCQDIEGDTGRNTLPMQVGLEKARMIAYPIALTAMVFAALPYYLGWGGFELGLLIIQIPAILLLITLNNPISKGEDRKAQKQVRLAMLAGLIGFAISVLVS
ncbi:MAG: UbiA family prenyltransferase [Euryarchaeota archaeon]|nr:UbiA family prenyltransferase [Euryarchaeota archaeon]